MAESEKNKENLSNQGRSFSLDSIPSDHSCNSCYYCTQPPPTAEESTPELSFKNRLYQHQRSQPTKTNTNTMTNNTTSNNTTSTKTKTRKSSMKAQSLKMEDIKQSLIIFFTTYCGSRNWLYGHKQNGIQKYIFKFDGREIKNASVEYMYCVLLYLGKIVGINKKCFTHSLNLYLCCTSKINALCDEMALILQTLQYHNNPKLWKYIYSFLYNVALYFQHIQMFIGSNVVIKRPKTAQITKFKRQIKAVRYI